MKHPAGQATCVCLSEHVCHVSSSTQICYSCWAFNSDYTPIKGPSCSPRHPHDCRMAFIGGEGIYLLCFIKTIKMNVAQMGFGVGCACGVGCLSRHLSAAVHAIPQCDLLRSPSLTTPPPLPTHFTLFYVHAHAHVTPLP